MPRPPTTSLRIALLLWAVVSTALGCAREHRFAPPQGGFSVAFPAAPSPTAERVNTPLGYAEYVGGRAVDGALTYDAGVVTLAADLRRRATTKAILQGIQQLAATEAKAKIGDVAWDGDLGGMRYVLWTEAGPAAARYDLLRGDRLIRLAVAGDAAGVRAKAGAFFDSYREEP